MSRISILFLLVSVILYSCSDDEQVSDVNIVPELQPYVDRFLEEGAKRGMNIDLEDSGLDIIFEEDISTAEYLGICRYKLGANEIGIDRERWDEATETRREWLVYHELGHCVLDRGHRNDRFDNGMWKSLMRGSPLTNEELSIPLCYLWERNQYYIDELFDETTEAPAWINQSFSYDDAPERDEVLYSFESDEENFSRFLPGKYENFEFEFIYRRKGGGAIKQIRYSGSETLEFYFINIAVIENIIVIGSNEIACYRKSFEGVIDNKVTVRQKDGTTTLFVNEDFIHAFPSYKNPIERIQTLGNADIEVKDFNFWSLK